MTNLDKIRQDFAAYAAAKEGATKGTWYFECPDIVARTEPGFGLKIAKVFSFFPAGLGEFICLSKNLPLERHAAALLAEVERLEKENAGLRTGNKTMSDELLRFCTMFYPTGCCHPVEVLGQMARMIAERDKEIAKLRKELK